MLKLKYKKLAQLKPEDIDDVLYEIYKCQEENSDDKAFQKIWKDNFCDKFENKQLFHKNNGEYEDQIIKILYDKFYEFFRIKKQLKDKFDEIKYKLDQTKNH